MGRKQNRHLVSDGDPVEQDHDLLDALRIEVGERFIEEEEASVD